MFRPLLTLLVVVFLSVAQLPAALFIEPTGIDVATVIPPAPEDDSPAGLADLETVLAIQADRTPGQLKRVERVANQTIFSFAQPELGPWFTPENLPVTAAFFKTLTQESYAVATTGKRLWTRPRPHLRDPHVKPHPRASRSASYPSGHSSDAATWAIILDELYPDHRDAFAAQVREVMWCRVLGGSHYPSDTTAGRILGEAIGREMLKSPAMKTALDEVRRELAPYAASVLPPPPPAPPPVPVVPSPVPDAAAPALAPAAAAAPASPPAPAPLGTAPR
ncbi:MAG: phosphatase PAP2 family protein [Verrucomicrobia bacterium]|nr:phosphatase PAP2 family protein [Verrucomicrobiota bacterium]